MCMHKKNVDENGRKKNVEMQVSDEGGRCQKRHMCSQRDKDFLNMHTCVMMVEGQVAQLGEEGWFGNNF